MARTKTEIFQKILELADIPHNVVEYPHCKKIAIHTTVIGSDIITKLHTVGFESLSIGIDLKDQEYFVLNY
jgi:hypothetical protein